MNPLPATEVRRRGTRMRRRNNALATIGGVAAAAIIATPVAMAANRTRSSEPQPATPSPSISWAQEIPADFPLTDGLPAGTKVSRALAPSGLVICGNDPDAVISDGAGAGAVASATTAEQGSEGTEARNLTLYADADTAVAATAALEQLVTDCPTDPNGSGDTLVNAVAPGDLGGDASYVVTQQARGSDGLLYDLTTVEVVRTGNAVYVASSHTSAGGQQVADTEVQRLADRSAGPITALDAFAR